jgi:fused signal recognition particle receptor
MFSFLKSGGDAKPGWGQRLRDGLARTRQILNTDVGDLFAGSRIDDAFFEELESKLLAADVGVAASQFLIERLRSEAKRNGFREARELKAAMRAALLELLTPIAVPLHVTSQKPFIIMLVGVNGAGKTTSIGKLANHFQKNGLSVLLAAGDTFRAAAREQLQTWGERNNVAVITQQSGDAAAVIFDAINAARARNIDVVLADTAGRLPTQLHLMEEIKKVKRVIAKAVPGAPHEVLLVLDANTGQNAVNQVRAFDDALDVTGLVLTKLDGTAKGGVICAIAHLRAGADKKPAIPLRFIGVGEGIDDLQPFNADEFIDALLG